MARRTPRDMGDFVRYVVTGKLYNSNTRFRREFQMARWAFSINLWNGRVWGVLPNGKRKLLKTVTN